MRTTYALYARTLETREWVMCWNFDDEATARYLAVNRCDVGNIRLVKHLYEDGSLTQTEELETYYH